MRSNHSVNAGYNRMMEMPAHHHATHTEHIITFLEQGRLRAKHTQEVNITAGMLTVVPAGVPHSQFEGENVGLWWLSFCPSCVDLDETHSLMQSFLQVRLGALAVFELPKARHEYFIQLLREIQRQVGFYEPDSHLVVKSLLLLVLNEVKKASPAQPLLFSGQPPAINKALAFIQQNSLRPISLKDVAKAVHLNPSYLASAMKKASGYSVGEWISSNRLSEACSRLLHSDERVEDIACQVGWNDVTHFIRQFKKTYGATPAAWRKKMTTQGPP